MSPMRPPEPSEHPLLNVLGVRVRALRQREGTTRKQLAERSGLSERFVAEVEGGRGNISVLKLDQLAKALGVSCSALLLPESRHDSRSVVSLLGLRGAGKSTVGKALAEKWGVPFVELDRLVEAEAGMRLGELFAIHGEGYYRQVELSALKRFLATHSPAVLATGGGVVQSLEAFSLLKEKTRTVWLKASPEEHWQRVVKQGDLRPMENQPHAMAELKRRLREREPKYAEAEHIFDTSGRTLPSVVSTLARGLGTPGRV
jgi:XRE family aerobic/anaerobic benzoate catabolism transcriptional regulator